MKKITAGPVFLTYTTVALFLGLIAGLVLSVWHFFVAGIIVAFAAGFIAGMAAFFVARKMMIPPRPLKKHIRWNEAMTDAGKRNRLPAEKVTDGISDYDGSSERAGEKGNVPLDRESMLLAELADTFPELNIKAGLSHAERNKGVYFNTLRRFCEEYDGHIREIVRFTAEENWRDYSVRLQLLKNIFADMGNETLSMWARKLELASGRHDSVICKEETEPFCYAMYLFKEKLAETVFWQV
jgi:hypothetical protein